MKRSFLALGAPLGAAAVAFAACSADASADTTVVEAPAPQSSTTTVVGTPTVEREATYAGPDRRLIASGLVTFGLSYIPAVVVAGSSDTEADHRLYAPVVGPWLDLGDRPGCGAGHIGCDTETTYKVLLVVDGIFQDLGALSVVMGLLEPEHHAAVVAAAPEKPSLHLSPTQMGSAGYGMVAFGKF